MKKKALTLFTILIWTASLTGCSIEKLDAMTDRAINAIGTRVSDAMEDVDVREVLSNIAGEVEELLESMPQTSGAIQDTVSSLTSSVKNDLTSSGKKTSDESAYPSEDGDSAATGAINRTVEEGIPYTDKEDVVLYLHSYGVLPPNFITYAEAEALGWDGQSDLWAVKDGASIGGDDYGNLAGLLPSANGRSWKQCDIGYQGGNRGNERLCYSSDGLFYYSGDRFSSFTELDQNGQPIS